MTTATSSAPAATARSRPRRVGHEDRVPDAGAPVDRREQDVGVGELRDRARVDERRGLDHGQAGRTEAVDEAALDVGRDLRGLVLQPVARADLDDRDRRRQRHAGASSSRSTSGAPRTTWSPTATWSRATRPAPGRVDHVLHLHRLEDHERRVRAHEVALGRRGSARCAPGIGAARASGPAAEAAGRRRVRWRCRRDAVPPSAARSPSRRAGRRPRPDERRVVADRERPAVRASPPARAARDRPRRRGPRPRPGAAGVGRRPRRAATGRRRASATGSASRPTRHGTTARHGSPGSDVSSPPASGDSDADAAAADEHLVRDGGQPLHDGVLVEEARVQLAGPERGLVQDGRSRSTLVATPSIRVASSASTSAAIAAARSAPCAMTFASSES